MPLLGSALVVQDLGKIHSVPHTENIRHPLLSITPGYSRQILRRTSALRDHFFGILGQKMMSVHPCVGPRGVKRRSPCKYLLLNPISIPCSDKMSWRHGCIPLQFQKHVFMIRLAESVPFYVLFSFLVFSIRTFHSDTLLQVYFALQTLSKHTVCHWEDADNA